MALARHFDPTFMSWYYANPAHSEVTTTYKNFNLGNVWWAMVPGMEIHGLRVYSKVSGAHSLIAQLWPPDSVGDVKDHVREETFNLDGAGIHDLIWSAGPYIVTKEDMTEQRETTQGGFTNAIEDPTHTSNTWAVSTVQASTLLSLYRNNQGFRRHQDRYGLLDNSGTGTRPVTGVGTLPVDPLILPPENLIYQPTPEVHCVSGSQGHSSLSLATNDRTVGGGFHFTSYGLVYGIRFFTLYTGTQNVKCTLWKPDHTVAATKTCQTTAAGEYDCLFDTPYRVTVADIALNGGNVWHIGLYHDSGQYTEMQFSNGYAGQYEYCNMMTQHANTVGGTHTPDVWYAAGDNVPSFWEGRRYPCDVLCYPDDWVEGP